MADIWIPSVNFTPWSKTQPREILFVVLHHSGGTAASDIPTLTTRVDPNNPVSCHRYVTRTGTRYQFVRDTDIAWTCGVPTALERNPHPMGLWRSDENVPSLNFEMENDGRSAFTDAQYNAAADWTAAAVRQYSIPPDRQHLLGHRELTTDSLHQDPNDTWDWSRFMQLVQARLGTPTVYVDYPIKGDPTISRQRFHDVLAATPPSPVTPQADQAYDTCRQFGVNPAVALAFFVKESSRGTDGVAVQTRNWGNLINAWNASRATGQTIPAAGHNFPVYKTWLDGLADFCDLLTADSGPFAGYRRSTVRTVVPIYAPASENNTSVYIQQTLDRISSWVDSAPPPPPPPPPPTYIDYGLQAAPTISRAQFTQILLRFGSPAAPSAADCFTVCTANGVNPAVALAFFVKISQCGTVFSGDASAAQQNWGNLRDPATNFTQLLQFASWPEGLRYWCTRLTTFYRANGWITLSDIVPRYFSGSGGDPQQIAAELSAMIKAWQDIFNESGFTPGPPGLAGHSPS